MTPFTQGWNHGSIEFLQPYHIAVDDALLEVGTVVIQLSVTR
jgi:hypothetical protein